MLNKLIDMIIGLSDKFKGPQPFIAYNKDLHLAHNQPMYEFAYKILMCNLLIKFFLQNGS